MGFDAVAYALAKRALNRLVEHKKATPLEHPDASVTDEKIASVTRAKITDFFSPPFWDNIPDKPSVVKGANGTKNIFVSSTTPTAEAVYDIWIQI